MKEQFKFTEDKIKKLKRLNTLYRKAVYSDSWKEQQTIMNAAEKLLDKGIVISSIDGHLGVKHKGEVRWFDNLGIKGIS